MNQIIIDTFDDIHTDDLRDSNIGFAVITTMELITNMYDYFGTSTKRRDNDNSVRLFFSCYKIVLPI